MPALPPGFQSCLSDIFAAIENVDGWLTNREVEFLALVAACPTAEGEILEIGSFRGSSTIALAKGAALTDSKRISAVDPHPVWGPTIADEHGNQSAVALLKSNLQQAGVLDQVEIHQMLSGDLVPDWNRPIRLLWIDGDHSYEGCKIDFDGFSPHLADGAIIAFHDILTPFGCTQVFREAILEGENFAPVGFCGSIGWARYHRNPRLTMQQVAEKRLLSKRLRRLCGYDAPRECRGLSRLQYKIFRSLVPHGRVQPEQWIEKAAA